MLVTPEVSQLEMFALKFVKAPKSPLMSRMLKFVKAPKSPLMSVMAETSQLVIGPYFAMAAVGLALYS